jgi:hypothetical protein
MTFSDLAAPSPSSTDTAARIRPRDRDTLLQALRAGVVPRVGQQHIQVGRAAEVAALVRDLDRVADGGSAVRFVIGAYGSGKTFFLHLVRSIAQQKQLVTAHADLTPDRRLHATGGQARTLYAELLRSLATRNAPEGGALPAVVERFVSSADADARARGVSTNTVIAEKLAHLTEMVGGYDFAQVVGAYWEGHETGNETRKTDAVRWLRGEFSTRTDARAALGVRTIVDDANVYDHLKLLARFVRLSGYKGLLICLDEMVNLYKLANAQARSANYEQLLRILNDSLQGTSEGLGFLFGGTPEFLMDPRRGLFSYPALESRLAENSFAGSGLTDLEGPVIRLPALTPEDLYVLLGKLRHVFASGDPARYPVPDEALPAFMEHCQRRIGDAYFRTPRTTIRSFVDLLSVLEQNPQATWTDLLGRVAVEADRDPEQAAPQITDDAPDASPTNGTGGEEDDSGDDDALSTLRLG